MERILTAIFSKISTPKRNKKADIIDSKTSCQKSNAQYSSLEAMSNQNMALLSNTKNYCTNPFENIEIKNKFFYELFNSETKNLVKKTLEENKTINPNDVITIISLTDNKETRKKLLESANKNKGIDIKKIINLIQNNFREDEIILAIELIKKYPKARYEDIANMISMGDSYKEVESALNKYDNFTIAEACELAISVNDPKKTSYYRKKYQDISFQNALYLSTCDKKRIKSIENLLKNSAYSINKIIEAYCAIQDESAIAKALELMEKYKLNANNAGFLINGDETSKKEALKLLNDEKYNNVPSDVKLYAYCVLKDKAKLNDFLNLAQNNPKISISDYISNSKNETSKKETLNAILKENKKVNPQKLIALANIATSNEKIISAGELLSKYSNLTAQNALIFINMDENCKNKILKIINSNVEIDPNDIVTLVLRENYLIGEDFKNKLTDALVENNAEPNMYQAELIKMFTKNNIPIETKKALAVYDVSEKDFISAVKKLSLSGFKHAYKRPSLYLSKIDTQYTQSQNSAYDYTSEEVLESQREEVCGFFKEKIVPITRALKYLDNETFNQMLDKRTDKFANYLKALNNLNDENYLLLSKLTKLIPSGNSNQKIELCKIVEIFQNSNLNKQILYNSLSEQKVDINKLKNIIKFEILKKIGLTQEQISQIPKEKLALNDEFSYLLLNIKEPEIFEILKASILGDFHKFIFDKSNEYGKLNSEIEQIYKKHNLNYKNWLEPNIEDTQIHIGDKNYKIKLWDRNINEDLFIGNKTTCCSAICATGSENSIFQYITNTSFNIIEMYDEKGNTLAMSRVFFANVNSKPSLIIDSMELNNNFVKSLNAQQLSEVRDGFFNYIKAYAQKVANKNINIYFANTYVKVPTQNLNADSEKIDFIGKTKNEKVYINCNMGLTNPTELKENNLNFYKIA